MILISIRAASRPQAAARRLCTSRACTSANGEPRVPMRRTGVAVEDCAMSPSGARPRGCWQPYNIEMVILGIETTCDETAAALVERTEDAKGRILSNIVLSQVSEHAEF